MDYLVSAQVQTEHVGAGVTTTLNLDQIYNYSSITVNATGTPHVHGYVWAL